MLERNKSGKLITVEIIFFKAFLASVSGLTFSCEIVNLGADKILKCDQLPIYWKRRDVDIFDVDVITKRYNETFEVDNTTFNNDLKIKRTTFEEAGEYWCLSHNKNESAIQVIVIDKNISCEVFSGSQSIPLQPTEHFNMNCSIIFNASDSCEVKPLWTEKLSNKNLTTEISSGYNNGYMWLSANGNNGLKNAIFWLRVVCTCNVSGFNVKEWKVVESIYDTKYISPEIKLSTDSLWPTHGQWILILMSVVMFVISFLLIIAIMCERYRASRPKQPRNKPISKFPQIRRVIKDSTARNQSPKHRGIEEDKITPYYTFFEFNKRKSFENKLEKKANKSRNQLEEVSEYDVIDEDDPNDNYELCN